MVLSLWRLFVCSIITTACLLLVLIYTVIVDTACTTRIEDMITKLEILQTSSPHFDTPQRRAPGCPSTPPRPAYEPPRHDRYAWRYEIIKHPVNSTIWLPAGVPKSLPKIQHDFDPDSSNSEAAAFRAERQASVKKVFMRAWKSYKDKAWLADEVTPVSGGRRNDFGGWGATLIDSLDTLWIMDLRDEFEEAVAAATKINFLPWNSSIERLNMFETTIRHLGGFIAAYDLTDCKDERLLGKAIEVADMIYASFDTPNRMPVTRWDPKKRAENQLPADHGVLSELASSSLELARLSQITGDMRYYGTAAPITNLLYEQQNRTKLPGMFPIDVNIRASDLTQGTCFSLGAMSDSAYEYFGKTYQLLGGLEPQYARLYEYAMDTAIQHLLFRPVVPDFLQADILFSGIAHTDGARENRMEHLTCFAGGMFLLGGRLFGNETHIDIGRKLTNGCIWAYQHSIIDIMPESFSMNACPSLERCDWEYPRYSPFSTDDYEPGSVAFTAVEDPTYRLRPEAIESIFYLYRITGDPKLQDIAWHMFRVIDFRTETAFGNAGFPNVTSPNPHMWEKDDRMESYWMAETLKYFYLMFSDPSLISLDDFVFNTEGHPFRIPR